MLAENKLHNQNEKALFERKEGETFVLRGDDYAHFSDFTLKIIAEVDGKDCSEGFWLCVLETKVHQELERRIFILRASSFDSNKQKFLKVLRGKFSRGSFSLSADAQNKDIDHLYNFLKKEYQSGLRRNCYHTNHVGYQSDGYWYINKKLHFKNGERLPEEQHVFFNENSELEGLCIDIQEDLIASSRHFEDVMDRFFSLCKRAFGINARSFLAAAAFVIWRLICSGDSEGRTGKGAASIGLIVGQEKSIGKTTALEILAYAQGVSKRDHPLLVSLGDQRLSGTSIKKIQKILSVSTFVSFLDDGEMNAQLAEFLLQLQGGYMQGSMAQGNIIPKGSVLLTSNKCESARLAGRVLSFPFKKSSGFCKDVENAIEELFSLVKANKGFLTLWAVKYAKMLLDADRMFLMDLVELIDVLFPEEQTRLKKGLAAIMLTQAMLCITTKQRDDLISIFKQHISFYERKKKIPDVLHKLQLAVFKQIQSGPSRSKILEWLNPSVQVKSGGEGKLCPAIGLKTTMINQWQDLSCQDVKNGAKCIDDFAINQSMSFGNGKDISVADLRKRTKDRVVMSKGIKIPLKMLSKKLFDLIREVTTSEDTCPASLGDLLSSESSIEMEIRDASLSSTPDLEDVNTKLGMIETNLRQLIEGNTNNGVSGDNFSISEPSGQRQTSSGSQVASAECTPGMEDPNQPHPASPLLILDDIMIENCLSGGADVPLKTGRPSCSEKLFFEDFDLKALLPWDQNDGDLMNACQAEIQALDNNNGQSEDYLISLTESSQTPHPSPFDKDQHTPWTMPSQGKHLAKRPLLMDGDLKPAEEGEVGEASNRKRLRSDQGLAE